jgi:hypothetical protein
MALRLIGVALALAVGTILVVASTRPDNFRVQRSASMKAAPEKIFPLINDLKSFNTWNPFNRKDPNIKGSYSGAASGAGAAYAFEGNKDVGRGRIEITDSRPASEVRMNLHNLFVDMDAMIGREFEQGLVDLKTIVER